MKPIISKEEKERREKRRTRTISLTLLLIMVLSTFGYAFIFYREDNQKKNQNANSNNQDEIFLTYPKEEVNEIPVNITKNLEDYKGKIFYLAGANENESIEVLRGLRGVIYNIQPACYGHCEYDLPEKNCTEQLVVLVPGKNQRVYQEEECIFIEGGLKALDAFLYYLYK